MRGQQTAFWGKRARVKCRFSAGGESVFEWRMWANVAQGGRLEEKYGGGQGGGQKKRSGDGVKTNLSCGSCGGGRGWESRYEIQNQN